MLLVTCRRPEFKLGLYKSGNVSVYVCVRDKEREREMFSILIITVRALHVHKFCHRGVKIMERINAVT